MVMYINSINHESATQKRAQENLKNPSTEQ